MLDETELRLYQQMTQEQITEYKEIYDIFDSDGSGNISDQEVAQVMRTLGQNPTDEEVAELVKKIDVSGDGEIDFLEFLLMMVQQLKQEMNAEEELVEVFKIFDKDGDGQINLADLVNRFAELGDPISNDEAMDMIKFCDVD